MDRPHVTIHNMTTIDGVMDGFPADLGLHYEIAAGLPHQAVLTGSGTMLAAAAGQGVNLAGEDATPPAGTAGAPGDPGRPPATDPAADPRPWLVVVDGRGRLTRVDWLRAQPYWRDVLVLCCAATPAAQLARLRRLRVAHLVRGAARVDLAAALAALGAEYGVRAVRVDAGAGLNGQLLRAGLVDEVSLIVAPYLAGPAEGGPAHLLDGLGGADARRLALTEVQRLRDDHVWLRYGVVGAGGA
jgi:2,5-diamino-6-(ribosylamino)-4(3H)-pyrimidinone 5'-phosphate reductase